MQRILNKVTRRNIEEINSEHNLKFKLVDGQDALTEKELLIGTDTADSKEYLLIYIGGELFSLSHDDFMYNFLAQEQNDLDTALNAIDKGTHSIQITEDITE